MKIEKKIKKIKNTNLRSLAERIWDKIANFADLCSLKISDFFPSFAYTVKSANSYKDNLIDSENSDLAYHKNIKNVV